MFGDESAEEFSDAEDDDYERVIAAVRERVTNYLSREEAGEENVEHLISATGKFTK